ncbi:MAG TPA: DUF535 family protein [Burkholderiaceae bacterium]|jgi:hypothetical protein|nr:DUF535 family protein [Burkholderiaceae bacterium]
MHFLASGVRAIVDVPSVHAWARRVYPASDVDSLRRRLAFEWSAFRHAAAHREHAAFFERDPWAPVARAHPQLLQKVHKPFAMRGLDVAERGALVRLHYRLASDRVGPALLAALAESRDALLCRVPLPAGRGALPVWLGKQARFEREGELTLSLHDPFGSLFYSTCFTLRERDGEVALLVGSLNGTAPRDAMRHLTKLSHGVRPPSLLVILLQMLARRVGAARIDAVGRSTHAYWGNPRHEEIRFDYDRFWQEEGGMRGPDGLYELPRAPRRRALVDLPSQKRASYARRYAWLDELEQVFDAGWDLAFPAFPFRGSDSADRAANR